MFCDTCGHDVVSEQLNHCKFLRHELLKTSFELKKSEKDENISIKIYHFIKSKIKKCIVSKNDYNQIFALIENKDHIEALDLSSPKTKSWLRYSYFEQTGNNHTQEAYATALLLIQAEAIHNDTPRETIFTRIAMVNDTLYYDLSTIDGKIVKISKDEVGIVTLDLSTPIFVRTQNQKEQIMPVFDEKNSLNELIILLRIPLEYRQLFKIHLVSMFLEGFPIPIMSIIGEHGSIKSTISKSIKQIVDPSGSQTIALSKNIENLSLSFQSRYCVCLDNVSNINHIMSDFLCKAITGDGNAKRKLYTDSDEIIYEYKRKIILNGISPNFEFPDLVDRNVTYVTDKVSEDERITEEEFNKKFNNLLPSVLGQIFQTLSDAMKIHNSVKIEIHLLPRLADFAMWGECISRTLGYEPLSFINHYKDKIKLHSFETNESYPIISIVEEMLKDKDHYEDTVQGFFNTVKTLAESECIDINSKHIRFPKSSNKIRSHITQLKSNFRTIGLEIEIRQYTKRDRRHPKNRQIIYINKTKNSIAHYDENSSLPPRPSVPEDIQKRIQDVIGSDNGRGKLVKNTLPIPYLTKSTPDLPLGTDGNYGNDTLEDTK